MQPDVQAFNSFLLALAKQPRVKFKDAGKQADEIFKQIIHFYETGALDEPPNLITYNNRIACWANSGDSEAGVRALEILDDMKNKEGIDPDSITYCTVIAALAQAGDAGHAEQLLQEMYDEYSRRGKNLQPNVYAFNTVLSALAKSKEEGAAERAEALLKQMHALSTSGILDVEPDNITYSTILSCWAAETGNAGAGKRAMSILREMEALSAAGDLATPPDAGAYIDTIRAFAAAGDGKDAEELLKDIINGDCYAKIGPDIHMVHGVLQAYLQSTDDDAADCAETFIDKIRNVAENRPNAKLIDSKCYELVLHCWAKSNRHDSVDRAKSFFTSMEERVMDGDESAKPSPGAYSALVNLTAKFGDIDGTKTFLKRVYDLSGREEGVVEAIVPN